MSRSLKDVSESPEALWEKSIDRGKKASARALVPDFRVQSE